MLHDDKYLHVMEFNPVLSYHTFGHVYTELYIDCSSVCFITRHYCNITYMFIYIYIYLINILPSMIVSLSWGQVGTASPHGLSASNIKFWCVGEVRKYNPIVLAPGARSTKSRIRQYHFPASWTNVPKTSYISKSDTECTYGGSSTGAVLSVTKDFLRLGAMFT